MPFKWLKHAFAVDPPGAKAPTKQQEEIVERVCTEITKRHLTTPALICLEMFRPLNYLSSQVMHFFHPIATTVLDEDGYRHFAEFLERRGSIDYLCRRIEALEDDYKKSEKK